MELNWKQYQAGEDATVITTIDAHAAGEPLRIITGGLPELQGATMLERRQYMQQHYDHIRKALMWEPRGHRDMYGFIATQYTLLLLGGIIYCSLIVLPSSCSITR